jgi:hypothetical protein
MPQHRDQNQGMYRTLSGVISSIGFIDGGLCWRIWRRGRARARPRAPAEGAPTCGRPLKGLRWSRVGVVPSSFHVFFFAFLPMS